MHLILDQSQFYATYDFLVTHGCKWHPAKYKKNHSIFSTLAYFLSLITWSQPASGVDQYVAFHFSDFSTTKRTMTKSRKSPLNCRWCHKSELTRFIAVANVGGMFGTAVAFPISGLIQQDYGWKVSYRNKFYSFSPHSFS